MEIFGRSFTGNFSLMILDSLCENTFFEFFFQNPLSFFFMYENVLVILLTGVESYSEVLGGSRRFQKLWNIIAGLKSERRQLIYGQLEHQNQCLI